MAGGKVGRNWDTETQYDWDDIMAKMCKSTLDGMTTHEVCAQQGMPSRSSFYFHLANHDEHSALWKKSQRIRAHAESERALYISDDGDHEGNDTTRDKLRVDTRLRLAAFWNPEEFSARITQDMNVGPQTDKDVSVSEVAAFIAAAAGCDEESSVSDTSED